jgi:hypothetical protein
MDTEINAKYQHIMTKLYEKKEDYPNIIQLWETLIEHKKKDIINTLTECETMLDNIQDIKNDIPKKTLLMLYLLKLQSKYIIST